jgi:hypothetical protein
MSCCWFSKPARALHYNCSGLKLLQLQSSSVCREAKGSRDSSSSSSSDE